MKERPILFQGPMVRALLASTKTQTRRAVKPQPQPNGGAGLHPVAPYRNPAGDWAWVLAATGHGSGGNLFACPYGRPGDRLWVRESFWGCDLPGYGDQPCVVYDDEWQGKEYKPAAERPWGRKFGRIPSIHMPRDCSRITLEITEVRVERLQEISEADALAEGIHKPVGSQFWHSNDLAHLWDSGGGLPGETPRHAYRNLWERINGAGSWDGNPWVWVVSFKRAEA